MVGKLQHRKFRIKKFEGAFTSLDFLYLILYYTYKYSNINIYPQNARGYDFKCWSQYAAAVHILYHWRAASFHTTALMRPRQSKRQDQTRKAAIKCLLKSRYLQCRSSFNNTDEFSHKKITSHLRVKCV